MSWSLILDNIALNTFYIVFAITSISGAVIATFDGGCTKVAGYLEEYIDDYVTFLNEPDEDDEEWYEKEVCENEDTINSKEYGLAVTQEDIEIQFETVKVIL